MEHNPTQKFAELVIGKKTYLLTFDLDAVAKAEQLSGMSLIFGIDWRAVTAPRLQALLLAALLPKQPDMTMEKVRKMITPRRAMDITGAIYIAWFENQPDEDDDEPEEEENPTPPKV